MTTLATRVRYQVATKPCVSRCPSTGHWIVVSFGRRHVCGWANGWHEQGFRRWVDALAEANRLAAERAYPVCATRVG